MTTQLPVAPRHATIEIEPARREGRRRRNRLITLGATGLIALSGALAACNTPAASGLPSAIASALPSVDASAVASAASGAAITALTQVDTAIASAQTSGTLTADDAKSLTDLTAGIRTALESGDTAGAKTALTNLTTKAESMAWELTGDAGTAVKTAIDGLKSAMNGM
jgi:hypothetical protein